MSQNAILRRTDLYLARQCSENYATKTKSVSFTILYRIDIGSVGLGQVVQAPQAMVVTIVKRKHKSLFSNFFVFFVTCQF